MKFKEFLDLNIFDNFHFYTILTKDKKKIQKIKDKNNDVEIKNYQGERLTMAESRKIKSEVSIIPPSNKKRLVLINYDFFAEDSQNALLKTFEEGVKNTVFLLFVKSKNDLLKTILSRTLVVEVENNFESELAEKFLKEKSWKKREKLLDKIKEKDSGFWEVLEERYFQEDKNFEKYEKFLELKKTYFQNGNDKKKILIVLGLLF